LPKTTTKKEKPYQFWESILWMHETKMMLWVMIHSIPRWGKFDGMCMASSGTGSLVFTDHVAEVFILSAQVQPNAARLI